MINLREAGLSYAAIAHRFGLSRERVRQINKQGRKVSEDLSDETLITSLLKSLRPAEAGNRETRASIKTKWCDVEVC